MMGEGGDKDDWRAGEPHLVGKVTSPGSCGISSHHGSLASAHPGSNWT